MAFTIIEDWWAFLDKRTDSTLADKTRETSGIHPRVDEAAEFATSSIYNALVTKYARVDVDAFAAHDADAEMRLHAGALAMFALTSTGASRTTDIANDYAEAQTWLTKVRNGALRIASLDAAAETAPVVPKGFVRFKARERNFTRGKSGTVTEYDIRNPRL